MKKQYRIYILAITGLLSVTIPSCKKTLDELADLNRNENQPLKASSATLLTAAQYSGVMFDQGGFGNGSTGDAFIGIFSQHFAGNHAQGTRYNRYETLNNDFEGFFNDAYVSSLMNLKQLIVNAAPGEEGYTGIAQVLQAYQLGYLTSLFGDIPWSQALDVAKHPHPVYDKQADIYSQMQSLLSAAVVNLNTGASGSTAVSGDVIYNGSLRKWKAAAYLLKARYHNHFSKKDPAGSARSALAMVDSAKAAGFTSHAGDLKLPYDGASTIVNPWYGMWTNGMVVASQAFLQTLINTGDPRLNAYFSSVEGVGKQNVAGLGKVISGNTGTGRYMGIGPDAYSYFGQKSSPVLMATYAELLMIEAEAALRSGNASRAASAHNAAIAAQVREVLSLPGSLADDKAKTTAYLSSFANETTATISLEKIMTEKFKLMFTLEVESWMDVRRHDYRYPALLAIPVVDETATPAVQVAAQYIQRLLYPQSELNNNAANVPKATVFDKLPVLQ